MMQSIQPYIVVKEKIGHSVVSDSAFMVMTQIQYSAIHGYQWDN